MAPDVDSVLPLLAIVGPTASGKSGLALDLAQRYPVEIICADSRTVYTGMDIATAKPTPEERASVPHWGLDIAVPGERFTVADFQVYSNQKIDEIRARGHLPVLVGGSGLYVDSVLFDYRFGEEGAIAQRAMLNDWTLEQLQEYCIKNSIELPENTRNKRHLVRVIERKSISTKRQTQLRSNTIVVGIATDKTLLEQRIRQRIEHMLQNGVVEEAITLGKKYGWDSEAMTANGYPILRKYTAGELAEQEMVEQLVIRDRQLAKRQMTWFRRNPYIEWGTSDQLTAIIEAKLTEQ